MGDIMMDKNLCKSWIKFNLCLLVGDAICLKAGGVDDLVEKHLDRIMGYIEDSGGFYETHHTARAIGERRE